MWVLLLDKRWYKASYGFRKLYSKKICDIGISNNLVINYLNTFIISELKCILLSK